MLSVDKVIDKKWRFEMKTRQLWRWIGVVMFLLTAVACGGGSQVTEETAVSALSQAQATALAENAMQGFAAGDYTVWSRDWSPAMKGAIKEADFLTYRQQVMDTMGAYQSIESVTIAPSQNKGYVRWIVLTTFEKGRMEFALSFREDGALVEGVFPRPLG
jgi:hypothetical protein